MTQILETCKNTEPLWYNSTKHEVSYLLNYKCASTSIRHELGARKKSLRCEFIPFTFMRDPIKRAISIYLEMVKQSQHKDLSLKRWLIYVKRNGFYDSHQIPQSYWFEKAIIDQGKRLRIFTSLDTMMDWLNIDRLQRSNVSRIEAFPDAEDLLAIRELYADDIELYDRLRYESS